MTPVRVAAAALLTFALAGCGSSDSSTDEPGPASSASGVAAPAPTSAAGASDSTGGGSSGGNCADAPTAAKAALTGADYLATDTVNGCAVLSVVTTLTDPGAGVVMCQKVANEVFQLGIKSVVVVTAGTGAQLASADAGASCAAG